MRDLTVTGVQTCALPISRSWRGRSASSPASRSSRPSSPDAGRSSAFSPRSPRRSRSPLSLSPSRRWPDSRSGARRLILSGDEPPQRPEPARYRGGRDQGARPAPRELARPPDRHPRQLQAQRRVLLGRVAELLVERVGAGPITLWRKPGASHPATVIDEVVASSDVVLTGSAD